MKVKKAKQLLEKYLSGTASTKEKDKVDAWYSSIEFTTNIDARQKQLAGEQIRKQLQLRTAPVRKVKTLGPWIGIAAALVIIVLAQVLFKKSEPTAIGQQLVVVTTGQHEKLLSLPDSSLVTLKAYSTIAYPKHFSAAERKISLREGAAFFDVHHDERRKFAVETPTGLSVKVLGTSFLVQSFAKEKDVLIKVSTGKVEVSQLKKKLGLLTRGDQLIFDKTAKMAFLSKRAPVRSVPILFEGSGIKRVAAKLAYIYNINLIVGASVDPGLKTTAKFNSSLSIDELLAIVCKLHHLKYRASADKSTYTIYK